MFDDSSDRVRLVEVRGHLHKVIESRYQLGEFDVLFAPVMSPGIRSAICPMVVLMVDMQLRSDPENWTCDEGQWRAVNWEWSARAAQTLCVMSEYGANDACNYLGISREKILVIPPIISPEFLKRSSEGTLSARVEKSLPSRYLFYPSNTWPHKNHIGLVKALAIARSTMPEIKLVFTG